MEPANLLTCNLREAEANSRKDINLFYKINRLKMMEAQ
jgi:hypothetical protein